MCFTVVKAYSFAIMATMVDPSASALDFIMDKGTRNYAAELFVKGCVWRQSYEDYEQARKLEREKKEERMLWYWGNQ